MTNNTSQGIFWIVIAGDMKEKVEEKNKTPEEIEIVEGMIKYWKGHL